MRAYREMFLYVLTLCMQELMDKTGIGGREGRNEAKYLLQSLDKYFKKDFGKDYATTDLLIELSEVVNTSFAVNFLISKKTKEQYEEYLKDYEKVLEKHGLIKEELISFVNKMS